MGNADLEKIWPSLRAELLNTGDPRKKLLVEVVDGAMRHRAVRSVRNVNGPQDDGLGFCDDCSANEI
jgi:hypothetical protein